MSQNWRQRLLRLDRSVTPQQAVQRWGGDAASLTFASLRANAVFRFEEAGEGRYLKLIHAALRGLGDVEPVVAFAAHLAAAGAPVAAPVPSKAGGWVEAIQQGDDTFLAAVYREVAGDTLDKSCMDPRIFQIWGSALAALHNAATTFEPPAECPFSTIHGHWSLALDRLAEESGPLRAEADRIDAWLSTLSETDDFGLTHGDCNATNFLWDGHRIAVIDFDEPLYHWFPADVARPFREFPEGRPLERDACMNAMISGYRSLRPLSDEWVRRLPWLVRLIDLDIYAWAQALPAETLLPGDEKREEALGQMRRNLSRPLPE